MIYLAQNRTLRRSRIASALSIAFCAALLCGPINAQELRTWRDSTGSFSVQAKLIERDATSVTLQRESGANVKVPTNRLSKTDLDYLAQLDASKSASKEAVSVEEMMFTPSVTLAAGEIRLADLPERIRVPVFIDQSSLNTLGLSLDATLKIPTPDGKATVADQLDDALQPLELSWQALPSMVVVTSRRRLQRDAEVAVYRFRSLVPRNARFPIDYGDIMYKVQTAIAPESWLSNGGEGAIVPLPPVFVVRQSPENQRAIQQEFNEKPLRPRVKPGQAPKLVDVVGKSLNVRALAETLSKQLGIPVKVDEVELKSTGAFGAKFDLSLKQVAVNDLLESVLPQLDCDWIQDNEGIQISNSKTLRKQVESRRVVMGFAQPRQTDEVRNVIMQTVSPGSWIAQGGPGTIQPAGGKSFNIKQSQPVFKELERVVTLLNHAR